MALEVAVVGAGAWGVALAAAAARASGRAWLHSRKDKLALPQGVAQLQDLREVGKRARLVVLAVPSAVARAVARELGDSLDGRHVVVHGVRGLEGPRLVAISDVVRQETPARRVGALGGPALAHDLLAGRPSVMVCGSNFPEVSDAVAEAFGAPSLRLYPTRDLRGLEWASALVGALVIGVGAAQELDISAGLIAAVTSRGIEEAARIAAAAGGEERTLLGLAGYGDLLASIAQDDRPEVLLGRALARGLGIERALSEAGMRVEAVELIPRVVEWCRAKGVDVPIFSALARAVFGKISISEVVHELMTNPMRQ
jgi:glycerol-3-phosphate dehydrogenase (NAD(P)+)